MRRQLRKFHYLIDQLQAYFIRRRFNSSTQERHYDAFISYSHALDGTLAPVLEAMIQKFAKPWYRARDTRVFRDNASLSANPNLWMAIERSLASSDWLILMASPDAAKSIWVEREVAWWFAHKSPERLLIALTSGTLKVSSGKDDNEGALPPVMVRLGPDEPRYVDLRWLTDRDQVDQSNPKLRDCVADLASAIKGVAKDDLVGEHILQHRRAMWLARSGVTALAILTAASLVATFIAVNQQKLAVSRQLLAQAQLLQGRDPRTALRLAEAADEIDESPETHSTLVQLLIESRYSGTLTEHKDEVTATAFSPDAHTLATASSDESVFLWQIATENEPVVKISTIKPSSGYASSLRFSPDGHTLAIGESAGAVTLWDVKSESSPRLLGNPLGGNPSDVEGIDFSGDGQLLAIASGNDTENAAALWDISTLDKPVQISPKITYPTDSGFHSVAISPDKRTLAIGFYGLLLYDISEPRQPRLVGDHNSEPDPTQGRIYTDSGLVEMQFNAAGNILATAGGDENSAILWDVSNPSAARRLGENIKAHSDFVSSVAISNDGRTLVTSSWDGTAIVWDLTNPSMPRQVGDRLTNSSGKIQKVALSPDGKTVATGGINGNVSVWHLKNTTQPRLLPDALIGHKDSLSSVHFGVGDKTLITSAFDNTIRVWSVATEGNYYSIGRPLPGPPCTIYPATMTTAISPDRTALATSDCQSRLSLWNLQDPERLRLYAWPTSGFESAVSSLTFSDDGRYLIAEVNNSIEIWDVRNPREIKLLGQSDKSSQDRIYSLTVSRNGKLAATVGNKTGFVIWNIENPANPHQVAIRDTPHADEVTNVAFGPGNLLATASKDGTAILWDVSEPAEPRQLSDPLRGHSSSIEELSFSHDGKTLATGSNDNTVILWDVSSPSMPYPLGKPLSDGTREVTALDFSSDDNRVTAGNYDGRVYLWDISNLNTLRRNARRLACVRTGGSLSPAEWQRYISGIGYRDSCQR